MSGSCCPEIERFTSPVENVLDTLKRKHKRLVQAIDEALNAFEAASNEQKKGWEALSERQREVCSEYGSFQAKGTDVLQLNVGGFMGLCYLRSTLTLVDGSGLSAIFSGRWEKRLPRDAEGRIFLDEDPYVFQTFMAYLQSVQCYRQNLGMPFPCIPAIAEDKAALWDYFLDFWGLRKFMEGGKKIQSEEDIARLGTLFETDRLIMPSFNHLQSTLSKGYELLAKENLRLKACLEASEAEENFVLKYLTPEVIPAGLNVRGTVLTVSLRVLRCFPDSALAITFDDKRWTHQEEDLDKSGNYMMEYDVYCFTKIVEILRVTALYGIPRPSVSFNDAYMGKMENLLKYLFPGHEKDILQSFRGQFSCWKTLNVVSAFLPERKFELLYKASRDGWTSSDFHRLCDNQGSTLVVLTSDGGYTFGGYAQQPWMSRNSYVNDRNAFLFSVNNPAGLPPVKLELQRGAESALYDGSSHGPIFGGGHDLCVVSGANLSAGSSSDLGYTYSLPIGGQTSTFFTGAQHFKLTEFEVYKVIELP